MSTPSDFQALFANLRPRPTSATPSSSSNPQAQSTNSNASPFDPAAFINRQTAPNPMMSPAAQPSSRMASPFPVPSANGQDKAQSLLSLLKSGQQARDGSQAGPTSDGLSNPPAPGGHGRGISASDLVASFMGGSGTPPVQGVVNRQSTPLQQPSATTTNQAENPQNALLKLLNRSQSTSSQSFTPQPVRADSYHSGESILPSIETAIPNDIAESSKGRKASPIRVFGSNESKEATPFEPHAAAAAAAASDSTPKESKPIFTYTNPFEALTAMSRNQTPQPQRIGGGGATASVPPQTPTGKNGTGNVTGDKRSSKQESPEPSSTRRKLTPRIRRTTPTAEETKNETVTEKLDAVADEASKAAEEALANAVPDIPIKEEPSEDQKIDVEALAEQLESTVIEAAAEMKTELAKPENKGILEKELPTPLAREVKTVIDSMAENANGHDKSITEQGTGRVVPIYNFPIKPFVSITLKLPADPSVGFREDGVMEISRFKKEFDQLDRTLAAATSKYITYALVKSGGMRVIRQEDGSDRQVFKNNHDRIFNVAMCSTAANSTPTEEQAILGTGVGGSVYYATIFRDGNDLFEQNALDSESLIFPPYPLGDENTSGGQLKTRAKKSSRHPEFFAIGRGKHIHLIWPTLAMSSKYGVEGENRRVDIEKFFKERTLKITTGKAGKDFNFSEDDTMIVSLDKTGRLRFWDIRQLVNEANATASKIHAVDIRTPLLTLSTASTTEKVWPTSALFIDKLRPYSKATALRYVLVGLRQNHTLQLWDICLGKAVQEINFPHETENDGICSISYHPGSGIIVVGHPTRNSIYFIHLSAPRYGLPPMSQATYIERLAVKDPDLPKPESTACMSGIRELSFAAKGQLRSVELLPVHKSTAQSGDEPPPLFELYVVHSRGVTCLGIKKQDLGWNEDSKTIHPINALEEDYITMKGLDIGSIDQEDPAANAEPEVQPQPKSSKKKSQKVVDEPVEPALEASNTTARETSPSKNAGNATSTNRDAVNVPEQPIELAPKKKKKKAKDHAAAASTTAPQTNTENQQSRSASPQKASAPEAPKTDNVVTILSSALNMGPSSAAAPSTSQSTKAQVSTEGQVSVGVSGDWLDKEIKRLENGVTGALRKDFESLHRQIDIERKVQDAAASSRQEAMLRLISETLSDNVEKSLARIIISNFQQAVLPTLTNATMQTVETVLVRHLHGIVPNELGKHLPVAISAAMSNPQTLRVVTENVAQKIAHSVENAFTELLHTTITPSFKNLAINTAESMSAEVERRVHQQLQTYEAERRADRQKMDEVMDTVNGLAKTLADMARSQREFQQEFLQSRNTLPERVPTPTNGEVAASPKSAEELEIEEIRSLIKAGDFHNATIQWLKSTQQLRIFDEVFVPLGPNYLASEVAPLVAFSVAITLSNSLQTSTRAKIDWIELALQCIDTRDPEIASISDQANPILAELVSKLESCYMAIHQQDMGDPLLQVIPGITKRAKELRLALARGSAQPNFRYGA